MNFYIPESAFSDPTPPEYFILVEGIMGKTKNLVCAVLYIIVIKNLALQILYKFCYCKAIYFHEV